VRPRQAVAARGPHDVARGHERTPFGRPFAREPVLGRTRHVVLDDVLDRHHVAAERALDAPVAVVVQAGAFDGQEAAEVDLDALVGGIRDPAVDDHVVAGAVVVRLAGVAIHAHRVAAGGSDEEGLLDPVASCPRAGHGDRVNLAGRLRVRLAAAFADEPSEDVAGPIAPGDRAPAGAHREDDATRLCTTIEGVDDDPVAEEAHAGGPTVPGAARAAT